MISHVFKTYDEKTTVVVMHLDAGESTPLHEHDWPHDCFVVKGRVRLTIGPIAHELVAGDTAHFPTGARHQISALEPATVICPHDTAAVLAYEKRLAEKDAS